MENPRKAAKCMDFLSTGEMMDFHRKGGEMGRGSLSTENPHTENRKCGEKGWGDLAKSYRETLRRGDPCGRPRAGQSPSPTHHKIRFRRGRRPRRPEPDFSRTPRQGTRALPYKALRYRARADRVVRPYKPFRRGRCLYIGRRTAPLAKSHITA